MVPPNRCLLVMPIVLAIASAGTAAAQDPGPSVVSLDSLLDTRISTAAKYSQRVSEVAGSVTIVTSDDIERYGYRTLDQVLATVPGFYVSNDRNYSYIGTRGFSRPTDYNNRLLLLVNGNEVNEGVFGAAPMGSELAIPLEAIERIEIVRGPGSALYGTGAMFGVINLITRPPSTIDGGDLVVDAGSFGRRGARAVLGRRFDNGLGVMVSGLLDRTDGQDLFYQEFKTPATHEGVAHNLDWERRSAILGSISYSDFRLHGRFGGRRKAVPTASYGTAFDTPGAETWDAYSYLELDFDRQLNAKTWLSTRAYYNHYMYEAGFPFSDSAGGVTLSTEGSDNKIVGGEAALRFDLTSANRLTIGSELRKSLEGRYFVPRDTRDETNINGPFRVLSGYLQDEHDFSPAFSLVGGVRYDASSVSENSFSPRAAALVRPAPGTTLKLLYGQAFRAPSVYEASASSGLLRNPGLKAERSRTLELVWQQHLAPGVLLSSSLFQYRMRQLIDLTLDSASGLYQYRNVATAKSAGLETGLDARLGNNFSGFASYTYQRTVDQDQVRLTNSPAHLLKAGFSGGLTDWLRAGFVGRFESSRRTVQDTSTDPSLVVDLNLGLTHRVSTFQSFEVMARVNNVFNTRYATPGGIEHQQAAILQDGRNVSVELRYEL